MRLGIDVRKLGDGGIGEYIRETLVGLRTLRPDLEIVAFGTPEGRTLLPLDGIEWVPVRAGQYSIAEHFVLPAAARARGIDLFHAPHYVLPLAISGPLVVTVHDLIHVLLPRSAAHRIYGRWMIRWACRRSRRVITVSEASARDLRQHLGIEPGKIRVVWNGVSSRFRVLPREDVERALARLGLRRPYVLFVGNCLPHKNVETLVRAWGRLDAPRPDLVLCGKAFGAYGPLRQARAEVAGAERVQVIETVSADDLVALYNGAEMLASASLYEGFCLPVVEAFACGVPVLASDAGAVPEIAGEAALLVSPRRVDLIAREMYRLLTDRELREGLVEKGRARAARFSWLDAAEKTLSVYEEILGHS